jgi:hypothetical protein
MKGRTRKVAHTEDRFESPEPVCGYNQCQARLSARHISDGWQHCDEECAYYAQMEEREQHEPDPSEDEE